MSVLRNLATTFGISKPTALEQATQGYEQAQRDLLTASANREHYAAAEVMLQKRIGRLRTAITRLSEPNATNLLETSE